MKYLNKNYSRMVRLYELKGGDVFCHICKEIMDIEWLEWLRYIESKPKKMHGKLYNLVKEARQSGRFEGIEQKKRKHIAISLDHIHPVSRGGGNGIENLGFAHVVCNRDKGNMIME